MTTTAPQPGLIRSLTPLLGLIALLALNVYLFGDSALGGPHQTALLASAGLATVLAISGGVTWRTIQERLVASISIAIPAILINTPGTSDAAATALDGYPLSGGRQT